MLPFCEVLFSYFHVLDLEPVQQLRAPRRAEHAEPAFPSPAAEGRQERGSVEDVPGSAQREDRNAARPSGHEGQVHHAQGVGIEGRHRETSPLQVLEGEVERGKPDRRSGLPNLGPDRRRPFFRRRPHAVDGRHDLGDRGYAPELREERALQSFTAVLRTVALHVGDLVVGVFLPVDGPLAPFDRHVQHDDLGVRGPGQDGQAVLARDEEPAVPDRVVGLVEAEPVGQVRAPPQIRAPFHHAVRLAPGVLADDRDGPPGLQEGIRDGLPVLSRPAPARPGHRRVEDHVVVLRKILLYREVIELLLPEAQLPDAGGDAEEVEGVHQVVREPGGVEEREALGEFAQSRIVTTCLDRVDPGHVGAPGKQVGETREQDQLGVLAPGGAQLPDDGHRVQAVAQSLALQNDGDPSRRRGHVPPWLPDCIKRTGPRRRPSPGRNPRPGSRRRPAAWQQCFQAPGCPPS